MKRAEFDYHSHGSLMDKENWLIRENDVLKARLKDPDEWGALLWGEFIDPTTKCLGSHEGCDANFSNKEELEKHILQCSIVEEWEWSYGWEHDANYCPGDGKRFPDCDGYYSNKKEGRERISPPSPSFIATSVL